MRVHDQIAYLVSCFLGQLRLLHLDHNAVKGFRSEDRFRCGSERQEHHGSELLLHIRDYRIRRGRSITGEEDARRRGIGSKHAHYPEWDASYVDMGIDGVRPGAKQSFGHSWPDDAHLPEFLAVLSRKPPA